MTALGKAIAKGYKATHDGVTKLYRKTTNVFGMSFTLSRCITAKNQARRLCA